jgi:hypothetical protein
MADDTTKVVIPSTGEVYKAATGTTAPTSAISSLSSWTAGLVGFISENGVTQSLNSTTTTIKAFQNATVVRTAQTEFAVTYAFEMLEMNPVTLALYYGSYSVVDTTGGSTTINGTTLGHFSYILDFVDSLQKVRIYIPDGQITTRGDTTYKNGEATPLPVTITAYPDGSGNNAYKWVDHDITVST